MHFPAAWSTSVYASYSTIFEIDNIEFNYEPTPRNGPIRQFFVDVCEEPLRNPIRISREEFDRKCPLLYHRVEVNRCL